MRGTILILFAHELLQSMKQRVNYHDIRVETIDSRRQNKIAGRATQRGVPLSEKSIEEHPCEKLQ
jgi:hypothetical protein